MRKIEVEEIEEILMSKKKGKSPGPDGFQPEFYQKFPKIREKLEKVFEFWLEGKIDKENALSYVRLLPKEGGESMNSLDKMRPISLLNVDYKLFTKIITERIGRIIPKYINLDQTGFVKGRNIITNVAIVKETIKRLTDEGIITFLDFSKAFDKVSHEYLWALLRKMNLNEGLINTLIKLYSKSFAQILSNDELTGKFKLREV